jgi:dimethylhistidine N-methyltransferase
MATEILNGLRTNPKYLLPKYFYDDKGSQIFQEIMKMPEYYLTDCELEIFQKQKDNIARAIGASEGEIDLIELGCGDGFKTKILLAHLVKNKRRFNFIPIDISSHALDVLLEDLNNELPGLSVKPKEGDYFKMIEEINISSHNRKVVLFLGANIGNYLPAEAEEFMQKIDDLTEKGDKCLIGFDMIKSPEIIYKAYSDPRGLTKRFNLNLLERLNRELGANFETNFFEHFTEYNPMTGSVKSYLVSTKEQRVFFESVNATIKFRPWEPIFMELSQKYTTQMIEKLAQNHGFQVENNFRDKNNYFVDSLLLKV